MDFEIVAALAGGAVAGFGAGAFTFRRFFPVKVSATHATVADPAISPSVEHEHEYDRIRGSGKMAGRWRCGICNEPQPKEEAAA